jgi:hypothetical protein
VYGEVEELFEGYEQFFVDQMTWKQEGLEMTMGLLMCVRKGLGQVEALGPVPTSTGDLDWLPDDMVCRYQVHGVRINGVTVLNFHGTGKKETKIEAVSTDHVPSF